MTITGHESHNRAAPGMFGIDSEVEDLDSRFIAPLELSYARMLHQGGVNATCMARLAALPRSKVWGVNACSMGRSAELRSLLRDAQGP